MTTMPSLPGVQAADFASPVLAAQELSTKAKSEIAAAEAEERQRFDSLIRDEKATSDEKLAKHNGSALKDVFNDPEKMLKLWLLNETRPNPFSDEQKDPMESFGKFIQSMLMQNQTRSLDRLEQTTKANSKYAAMSMVDKVVEIESDKFQISEGRKVVQNFIVPEKAQGFCVEVKNAAGQLIYTKATYDINPGINQFTWDGTNQDGNVVPTGDYKMSIFFVKKTVGDDVPAVDENGNVIRDYAADLNGHAINEKVETISAVDRGIQFSYELPAGLENLEYASVWILNSKNTVVHKAEVEAASGKTQTYSWNCIDGNGRRVPEDVYSVQINLKDGKRDVLKTDKNAIVRVTGKVQGIEVSEGGEANLITSRIRAPLSTVKRIINEEGL